jgi:hypothetical protein
VIRVERQPEPDNFNEEVRVPGLDFIQKTLQAGLSLTKEWNKGNGCFWRKAIPSLEFLYNKICAYSSLWLPPSKGTVDHYISKSRNNNLAYEWNNFRLTRLETNRCKGLHTDILDPFEIGENWFTLDFTTFMLHPNQELPNEIKQAVQTTIRKLKLNEDDYVNAREMWYEAFKDNPAKLAEVSPFIAHETQRQGI